MKVAISVSKKVASNYSSVGAQLGVTDIDATDEKDAVTQIRHYKGLLDELLTELLK